jgi:putative ABC transport system ATP-binding protein
LSDPLKPLIYLENVSKSFPTTHGIVSVLRNIHIKIFSGESVAIVGPSGSGKSTLLHILGCLDQPTEGKYFLNSTDVSSLDDLALSRIRASQIGFVFQSFNLVPQLTVLENMQIPFLYQSEQIGIREAQERIHESIDAVFLSHRLHYLPSRLSGGEMQRVAIARALLTRPQIILADEPTGNLDSETSESILKLFTDLHRKGMTFLMITHDRSISQCCERTLTMSDGCTM